VNTEPLPGSLTTVMSPLVLQCACIDALVGELEARGVPKHVRMHAERHFGDLTKPARAGRPRDRMKQNS